MNSSSGYTRIVSMFGLIALFALLTVPGVCGVDIMREPPAYLIPCKIYQPGFTKCSTSSIQKLFKQLAIGIPEITSKFGPIDPMTVKKVLFKQDNNEVATIKANLTDIVIKGFADMVVKQSKVSKKDFSWETKMFLPNLRMDGKYKMNGKVLLIPLKGNGTFFIEIENLDIIAYTKTRLYEKEGFTFDNVTEVHVDLMINGVKTRFDNLFNGNKEIEKSTNEFFNENWKDFFEALRPVINQTIEEILFDLMQILFNLIPANFFVTDIPTSKELYGN